MVNTEKLLSELIALPSVNPAFLPVNHPHAGEQRVADFLAHQAAGARLEVEFKPVLLNRSNLFVRLSPGGKVKHRILLAPHLDTVGGSEVSDELFTPRRRNGRLYGRGACDTKGSVAVMFAAICELAAAPRRFTHTEIIFAGLVDEECVQAGSRALVESGLKADLAIVGEPTRLKIVTAHKGVLWLKLETRGKAARGARPELGRNAVHAMSRIVDLLQTRYAAQLRLRKHPLLGYGTINVGAIQGGRQPNIVPAECVSCIDRRTLPGETDRRVMQEIAKILSGAGLKAKMTRTQDGSCFPLETNPRSPLVRQFLQQAGQSKLAGVDFFSDAGVLSHGGIPSVVFGPGDIAQAHTPDEWISLKQLEPAGSRLLRFLRSLP